MQLHCADLMVHRLELTTDSARVQVPGVEILEIAVWVLIRVAAGRTAGKVIPTPPMDRATNQLNSAGLDPLPSLYPLARKRQALHLSLSS